MEERKVGRVRNEGKGSRRRKNLNFTIQWVNWNKRRNEWDWVCKSHMALTLSLSFFIVLSTSLFRSISFYLPMPISSYLCLSFFIYIDVGRRVPHTSFILYRSIYLWHFHPIYFSLFLYRDVGSRVQYRSLTLSFYIVLSTYVTPCVPISSNLPMSLSFFM